MTQNFSDPAVQDRGRALPLHFSQLDVERPQGGGSLEDFLSRNLCLPVIQARDLVDFGSVQVDGKQERNPKRRLRHGQRIHVHWPRGGTSRHYELDPSRVVHRDAVLLAYNKERGIPSQQTPYDGYNNVFAAVQRHVRGKEGGSVPYVALHHRLDQETSGIMVFVLDKAANRALGKAFENQKIVKQYLAWIAGEPQSHQWTSRQDIGRFKGRYCTVPRGKGKWAETDFQVLHRSEEKTLVLARPKTGRTHQIRLHLAAGGWPIWGDTLYGGPAHPRLLLHAWRMTLPHPVLEREVTLTAPLPHDWPEARSTTLPP